MRDNISESLSRMMRESQDSIAGKTAMALLVAADSLFNAMRKKRISAAKLAKQSGVPEAAIKAALSGDIVLSPESCIMVAEVLGCKVVLAEFCPVASAPGVEAR